MAGTWAALAAAVLSVTRVAPVGDGNALTLPAQRHVVRMDTRSGPVWLLALQQNNAEGGGAGLSFFRSTDDARSFQDYAPIQPDRTERDEADLVAVGPDVALVYAYEGPELTGSKRHNVYFQWWRGDGKGGFTPEAPLEIFASASERTAYSRAELAVDSKGRLWVQAFFMNPDGSSTLAISVSTDGGQTFERQPDLDTVPHRGGGRMLSLGTKLVIVYGMHDGFLPARLLTRDDDAPLDTWSEVQQAFPEGIYHGAALSAVADGAGGMHLVYKNENDEMLYYRHFDGTEFGPAVQVDTSSDWALQPTTTRVGDDVAIYDNHVLAGNTSYEMQVRWLHDGVLSAPQVVSGSGDFKGYPNAPETLPPSANDVPCFYSETPDPSVGGDEMVVSTPVTGFDDDAGPIARITGGPFVGDPPLTSFLDSTTSSTTTPGDWIRSAHWDFGDGTTSNQNWLNHTFSRAGTYTVKLTVTQGSGATSTATQVIRVGSGG